MSMDLRLKSARIQNFRSIRDIAITFAPEITLLVGPNGGGKSNILRALGVYFKKYAASELDKNPYFQANPSVELFGIDNNPLPNNTSIQNYCFHMAPLRVYEGVSDIITDFQ